MKDFQTQISQLRDSIYQGNVTDGVNQLGTWLQDDSLLPDERVAVLLELVFLSVACGDLDEAVSRWNEVRVLSESDNSIRMKAFDALFQMIDGENDHGLSLFEECLLKNADNFELYFLRGLGFTFLEQFDHAQADLERANSLCPNNVLIWANMGDVCVELHDIPRAISLHEAVLDACPDFRRSLMSLGILYFDLNRYEDGFRLFQCLVAYDPMNWFSWTCLGDIRLMTPGRTFQALPYYAAAIVAGTDNGQTYLNLVRGLYALGRYEQGLRVLLKFEKSPGHQWQDEELPTAHYLKLIGEVIRDPGLVQKNVFERRFQKLKPNNDSGNHLLFQVLASLCAFSYEDSIEKIFSCHMTCFIEMAKYMSSCDNRVIQPEEAILLGVLARMYIWHGLLFEARALLGMLNKAEEARVVDMTSMLWNCLYEHEEAAENAGIHIERFHEYLIRDRESEASYDQIRRGIKFDASAHVLWSRALSQSLESVKPGDFSRVLYRLPYEKVFDALELYLNQTERDRSTVLREFWAVCEMCLEIQFDF